MRAMKGFMTLFLLLGAGVYCFNPSARLEFVANGSLMTNTLNQKLSQDRT
jgi:hypothetical protein